MSDSRGDVAAHRGSIVAFVLTLAVTLPVLFLSVLVAVPPTTISLGMGQDFRNNYSAFVSQGWNFFTKDLQGNQFGVYATASDSSPVSLLSTPQTRIENAWGLTRNQRAQGPELANLANAVTEWQECATLRVSCGAELGGERVELVNTSPLPTLCGPVLLTQERQSPWSYRAFPSAHEQIVDKVALVDVVCPANGEGS
ncbi:MAG: hypothetical protein K0R81_140 [Microbacterium sp.]|jgi:antimicrobial peptide system SdpA family protein|nr:hypothetical protein [Microbacterium sp.]